MIRRYGFGAVRRGHLPDLALHAVLGGGKCQRRAPLPGTRLGRELGDALLVVVVGLRNGSVRLVRSGRADALVLVVDACRGVEHLLQTVGAEQRRRPPQPVHVEHAAGDVDVAVLRDLLHDERHREQRRKVVGPDRLHRARVQRRRRRRGEVRNDVVPLRRDLIFAQQDLGLHDTPHRDELATGRDDGTVARCAGSVSRHANGPGAGAALRVGRSGCHPRTAGSRVRWPAVGGVVDRDAPDVAVDDRRRSSTSVGLGRPSVLAQAHGCRRAAVIADSSRQPSSAGRLRARGDTRYPSRLARAASTATSSPSRRCCAH